MPGRYVRHSAVESVPTARRHTSVTARAGSVFVRLDGDAPPPRAGCGRPRRTRATGLDQADRHCGPHMIMTAVRYSAGAPEADEIPRASTRGCAAGGESRHGKHIPRTRRPPNASDYRTPASMPRGDWLRRPERSDRGGACQPGGSGQCPCASAPSRRWSPSQPTWPQALPAVLDTDRRVPQHEPAPVWGSVHPRRYLGASASYTVAGPRTSRPWWHSLWAPPPRSSRRSPSTSTAAGCSLRTVNKQGDEPK